MHLNFVGIVIRKTAPPPNGSSQHRTAMQLHDASSNREPEARALRLARSKGLKNGLELADRQAWP